MHKSTFFQDDKKNWVNFQSRTLYVCESRHRRAGGALGFLIAAQVAHTQTHKKATSLYYTMLASFGAQCHHRLGK